MFATIGSSVVSIRASLNARPAWQLRLLRVAFFVVLTAIAARVRIELPGNPVPITAQTLIVWMAGMALGPVEGALSQITYVSLIALGAPIDARSLGAAALVGPTAGYLLGFIPGAFVAGLAWRKALWLNVLAGIGGVLVVHTYGTIGVALTQHLSWSAATLLGSAPFLLLDCGKALLAASLVNLGRVYPKPPPSP